MRRNGILGGMGPEATILLQERLLRAVQARGDKTPARARDDADHIPLLIDMNPQVPSRIAHLIERTGSDPAPVLAGMAARLEAGGAEALAMPCNTAHAYAEAIRAAVAIPFLDMVALSARHAAAGTRAGDAIGILGSPALALSGIFAHALAALDRRVLHPGDGPACLAAIRAIKAGQAPGPARATIAAAARDLADRGAARTLVACSEFSIHADAAAGPAPVFDTLDILVAALAAFATGADVAGHGTKAAE